MYEESIHIYEKLPLCGTGVVMGLVLILLHVYGLARPAAALAALGRAHTAYRAGAVLLGVDFLWIAALLFKADWNPLCMPLYEFDSFRGWLLILCPVIWFVLASMAKEHLFARALGLFLLLAALLPLSAAFLKDPVTRLLIPIWWYPVLTVAMFWVAKPHLFRDWAAWLQEHPAVFKGIALFGTLYGAAVLACAILYW